MARDCLTVEILWILLVAAASAYRNSLRYLGGSVDGVQAARGIPLCPRIYRLSRKICDEEDAMLRWALIFLVVAIVAGIFGFAGIMIAAAGIAKLLFYLFLVLFLVSLVMGLVSRT
jgi:uncharacterized membrane protein YtjA (UPF0391 family)